MLFILVILVFSVGCTSLTLAQETDFSFTLGLSEIEEAQVDAAGFSLDVEEPLPMEETFSLDDEDVELDVFDEDTGSTLDDEEVGLEPEINVASDDGQSFFSNLWKNHRFTFRQEFSYNVEEQDVVTNRSSLRLEWSKFFAENYYLFLDGKLTLFASNDHLSKAEDEAYLFEGDLREAYLQTSFGNISIKAGKQVIIWGEADGAVVTDVISPRDGSEVMFTTIEDARLGQVSMLADYYSRLGTWSVFVNPDPQTDIAPKSGTEYDMELFDPEEYTISTEKPDWEDTEYAFRWKRTFGKSDIALMAAHLIDNQPVYNAQGENSDGKTRLIKQYSRFSMAGVAGNVAKGNFLWKGEMAYKLNKTFQTEIVDDRNILLERDTLDAALGVEYSANGAYILSVEGSYRRILDWDEAIQGTREDESTITAMWSKTFRYETLNLEYIVSYLIQDRDSIHQLKTRYDFTDQLSGYLEAAYLDISDGPFRDKSRITAKLEYQF